MPILFPGKEEKGFVPAVVDFGNPDRSADGATVVVLADFRAGVGVRATGDVTLAADVEGVELATEGRGRVGAGFGLAS